MRVRKSWFCSPVPAAVRTDLGLQVHSADGVVARIGHVQRIRCRIERQSLRPVELSRRIIAVGETFPAACAADHAQHLEGVEPGDDHAVMVRIADEQAVARRIGQHLTRKRKRRVRRVAFILRIGQRRRRHQVLRGELRDHALDHRLKRLVDALARQITEHFALRIDDHDRRPGAHAIRRPDTVVTVVDDGVGQAVTRRDHADVLCIAFVVELGRMHADHDQRIAKLGFEALQVRDDVDAVDAAVGPEVEQDDAPAQIGNRQRLLDVDPVQIRRKFGSANSTGIGLHRSRRCHRYASCFLCGWCGVGLGAQRASRHKHVSQQDDQQQCADQRCKG